MLWWAEAGAYDTASHTWLEAWQSAGAGFGVWAKEDCNRGVEMNRRDTIQRDTEYTRSHGRYQRLIGSIG